MFEKMFRTPLLRNPDDGGAGGSANGDNGNGSGESKVTFTPEQQKFIDALVGERAKRAEASALNNVLKDLGVEKLDDAKTALGDLKKLKEAQLSDLEKAQHAAKDAQAKIDAAEKAKADALAQAQTKLMRAAVLAEAVKQNFDDSELSSVWRALQDDKALLEKIKAQDGDEFDGVDKAVEQIAKAHPKWLKTAPTNADINARNRGDKNNNGDPKAREAELRSRYRLS